MVKMKMKRKLMKIQKKNYDEIRQIKIEANDKINSKRDSRK